MNRFAGAVPKALTGPAVLSGQQVVGQWGGVGQALQDSVEEARVAHIEEPCSSTLPLLPDHANLLRWKENPFWRSHPLSNGCREIPFEKRSEEEQKHSETLSFPRKHSEQPA